MNKTIETIKVFNYDMSCPDLQRDAGQTYRVQYEMGKTYSVKWSPIRRGMIGHHAVVGYPLHAWRCYALTTPLSRQLSYPRPIRYAEVTLGGDKDPARRKPTDTVAARTITIKKEVSLKELILSAAGWVKKHAKASKSRVLLQRFHQTFATDRDRVDIISANSGQSVVATGDDVNVAIIGTLSQVATLGYTSKVASTGSFSNIAAFGHYSSVVAEGFGANIAVAGAESVVYAAEGRAKVSAFNTYAKIAALGGGSTVAALGKTAAIEVGDDCIVFCADPTSVVRLGKNSAAVFVWSDGERQRFVPLYAGEDGVVAGADYSIDRHGRWVQVNRSEA